MFCSYRIFTDKLSRGPSAIAEPLVNFGYPIHISGMAEARALKLCTKGDYIKSGQRDDKSPLEGVWFCSRDRFFVCTAVALERHLHSVICYQPCPRRRLLSVTRPTVNGGAAHALRLKLHRYDFSPCLLQTCLYNI